MNPTPLSDDLAAFAARARDFADANRVPPGHPVPPVEHAEQLRFKVRLEGWATAITYWYFVHKLGDGEWWRHLEVRMSMHSRGEPLTKSDIARYRASVLEGFDNQVRTFFPLHGAIAMQFDVSDPIPVKDPRSGQVSYRTPLAFHFMVKADSDEGTWAALAGNAGGSGGGLVDALGNPLRTTGYRNVADVVPEPAEKRGKVLNLSRERHRRLRQAGAKVDEE